MVLSIRSKYGFTSFSCLRAFRRLLEEIRYIALVIFRVSCTLRIWERISCILAIGRHRPSFSAGTAPVRTLYAASSARMVCAAASEITPVF